MHFKRGLFFALGTASLVIGHDTDAAVSNGFKVPDGFEVSVYAGDDLAHDIFTMTTDAQGRIVVAGRGYVKVLHDTDGDGRADKATDFAKAPKSGARGMYFDGNSLFATGDNGLKVYTDADGDGVADGEPQKIFHVKSNGEHTANGIVKGPDGWIYIMCGNEAGISREHATGPGSPLKTNIVAGALVRVSPDGRQSEVVAHGFRNPYDVDFDARGMAFTYDADGERDHYLPWYAGSRIFDIATGMEHGWIINGWGHSWSRPESNYDNVQRVHEVGRGSPTGVKVYQHNQFPQHYRNGLFAICWSFGRVYFFPLLRQGATVQSEMEIFMESATDAGFAPVDAVVGPDGDLFIAMGGRGTMGTVYKVSYTKDNSCDPVGTGAAAVVNAPQPLSSWSRAKWIPMARDIDPQEFAALSKSLIGSRKSRLRAIEVLVEVHGGVPVQLARDLVEKGEPEIAARAVWGLGRSPDSPEKRRALCEFTNSKDPCIARSAWEALSTLPSPLSSGEGKPDFFAGFESSDRRVRAATVLAAKGRAHEPYALTPTPRRISERVRLGSAIVNGIKSDPQFSSFNMSLFVFSFSKDDSTRLDAIRYLQKGVGDVFLVKGTTDTHDGFVAAGVTNVPPAVRQRIIDRLAPAFPTGNEELDRETGRLLAMLTADSPGLLARVTDKWTTGTLPEDDIHYLQIAARLTEERTTDTRARIADTLVTLQHKMRNLERTASRHWPKHVAETFVRLMEHDPELGNAISDAENFGLAEHALFAERLPEKEQKLKAAEKLLGAKEWTPELVSFVTVIAPDALFPLLRSKWDEIILRDAIVRALARRPSGEDRKKFLVGLQSFDNGTINAAARALGKLEDPPAEEEIGIAMKVLRRLTNDPKKKFQRNEVTKLLTKWSGAEIAIKEEGDLRKAYQPWFDWFSETYDQAARDLFSAADQNVDAFLERLKNVAWEAGDAAKGKAIFAERQCQQCHASPTRIGPHLNGITKRFSKEDLFAAIIDPNRDISAAYTPRIYETKSGESHTGFPVYNSPAATIIQTGASTTVRVTAKDVFSERHSTTSLMPVGLLEGLSDEQLADFYSFMKDL